MKKKYILLFLLAFSILLVACGTDERSDFQNNRWGETQEDVIEAEKDKKHTKFEETQVENTLVMHFTDISIDGKTADIEYLFSNEIDKESISSYKLIQKEMELTDKKYDENLSDVEKDKIENEIDEVKNNQEDIPEKIKLTDQVLFEGHISYKDVTSIEVDQIYNSLTSQFGEPDFDNGNVYVWNTERSRVFYNGSAQVSYTADYDTLEEYLVHKKKTE